MDPEIEFSYYDTAGRVELQEKQDWLATSFKLLAEEILDSVPTGRCQSLALTNLQQAFHWVDAALDPRR